MSRRVVPSPGVPWYVHPAEDPPAWQRLARYFASASGIDDGFVVVNVHNGPGKDRDSYYLPALSSLSSAAPGLVTLGYVDLDYGRRPMAEILEDVAVWRRLYGLGGVMLDRFPSGTDDGTASAALALKAVAHMRADGVHLVAGNPGIMPSPEMAAVLDVVCEFEGTAQDYLNRDPVPAIGSGTWHLVHTCASAELQAVHQTARANGVQYIFATEASPPHPWNGFPRGADA
ncbi:spherulation-specific family 4 protein [Kocuria sp. U4B]